jgi:uncharacterized spore protein YtfJ
MESNESLTTRPDQMATRADPTRSAARGVGDVLEHASSFLDRFHDAADAHACIGPVTVADGHTVIPVAAISLQGGFGLGFGGGAGGAQQQGEGGGGGGGGGGRGAARAIAIVDVSDQGVAVRPVIDVTRLALAGLALLGLGLLTTRGKPGGILGRTLSGSMRPD